MAFSHKSRLKAERTALGKKLDRLAAFIAGKNAASGGAVFANLPPSEQDRLARQNAAMQAYAAVLDERIAAVDPPAPPLIGAE